MNQLSINIKIENRNYPMTINSEDEEDIRLAGKLINDKIREYRAHFSRSDAQDLLSMVAIEAISDNIKLKKGSDSTNQTLSNGLERLNGKLSDYLAN